MIKITMHSPPLSLNEVAQMTGVSRQRILRLAQQGRIEGAFKLSGCWLFAAGYRILDGKRSGGPVKRRANSLSEYRSLSVPASPSSAHAA